jgi:alpha-1,2-mannosyltransferase
VLDTALLDAMIERLHMNDFGKFYYSTRAFFEGADMYGPTPATELRFEQAPDLQYLNMNPPHFHLLILPFAWLPPQAAVASWIVANLLALVVSMILVARELAFAWTPFRMLATVTGALVFAGTQSFFATGQLSLVLVLALTICWLRARHDRWLEAAVWLGACVSIKPFLLVFAPYLAVTGRLRALVVMIVTAAAAFAIGLLVFGVDTYHAWWRALGQSGDWAWGVMNASIFGFVRRAFQAQPAVAPVAILPFAVKLWPAAAAVVGIVTLVLSARGRTSAATDRAFALLLVAAQLMSPLGWIYYLWLPLGPVAATVSRLPCTPGRGRNIMRLTAAVAAIGFAWPMLALTAFQPHGWATLFIASIYFWATLALWLWLVMDARNDP